MQPPAVSLKQDFISILMVRKSSLNWILNFCPDIGFHNIPLRWATKPNVVKHGAHSIKVNRMKMLLKVFYWMHGRPNTVTDILDTNWGLVAS